MVPALCSAANSRMETTGITSRSKMPMLRNVSPMVASPVRNML
jgi:hypothetical protein